jgi:tetratricopeptide (TPR) repeat protein
VWFALSAASGLAQDHSSDDFDALSQSATVARESGHATEAISAYRRALQLRPEWAEGWWYLGALFYDADQFRDAVPAFQNVLKLAPNAPGVLDFLGLCEFETGDYEHALQHFEAGRASSIPDEPQLLRAAAYHFALLLNRDGQSDRALQVLSQEFAQGAHSNQVAFAFGLAMLRVPLLPNEVEISNEALIHSVGELGVLSARGRSDQVLDAYPQLISRHPNVPFLRSAYASALQTAGYDEKAVAQLQEEARMYPKAPSAMEVAALYANDAGKLRLGLSTASASSAAETSSSASFEELSSQATNAVREGRSEDAIRLLREALALRPDWQDGRWQLAFLFFSSKRCGEAAPVLKTWLAQNASSGTGWVMLGLCEFESRDFENALLHLEKGPALGIGGSPQLQWFARYRLALLLIHKSQFQRAASFIIDVPQNNPLAKETRFALGLALLRKALFPEEVPGADVNLVQSAGEISLLLHRSEYDLAFAKVQQLIDEYPHTAMLHYVYGVGLASLSRNEEAEAQFREELRLSPLSALTYIELAFLQLKTRRASDAIASAQRAEELAPDSAEAHFVLGRSLFDSGKWDESLRELQTAAQINPGSPEVHLHLAKAYAKLNQPENAEREAGMFDHLKAEIEEQNALHRSKASGVPTESAVTRGAVPAQSTPPQL